LVGEKRIANNVWTQNMPSSTVQQHFPSENWKQHGGHKYGKPDPGIVSCLVRDVLLVVKVGYSNSLAQLQEQQRKIIMMHRKFFVIEEISALLEFGIINILLVQTLHGDDTYQKGSVLG
jgi:hypothetical protein